MDDTNTTHQARAREQWVRDPRQRPDRECHDKHRCDHLAEAPSRGGDGSVAMTGEQRLQSSLITCGVADGEHCGP